MACQTVHPGESEAVLPDVPLRVHEGESSRAGQTEICHVGDQPGRRERQPGRVESEEVARPPPMWRAVGCSILARAVQVEPYQRQDQQHPRSARGRRQPGEQTGRDPPASSRTENAGHRQRQVQRLGIRGGEEERHGREGQSEHRQAPRVGARAQQTTVHLECDEPAERVQGRRQRDDRHQHRCDHQRQPCAVQAADDQRIQGEEVAPRWRVQAGREGVAVARDGQVPVTVPPDHREGEKRSQGPPRRLEVGGVVRVGLPCEPEHPGREHARLPDQHTAAQHRQDAQPQASALVGTHAPSEPNLCYRAVSVDHRHCRLIEYQPAGWHREVGGMYERRGRKQDCKGGCRSTSTVA